MIDYTLSTTGAYMIAAILKDNPSLYPLVIKILQTKGALGLYQDYSYTYEFIYDDEGYDLGELTYHRLCQLVRFLQDGETEIDNAYDVIRETVVSYGPFDAMRKLIRAQRPHARILDLMQSDCTIPLILCEFVTKYGRGSYDGYEYYIYDFFLSHRREPLEYHSEVTGQIQPDEYDVVLVDFKSQVDEDLANIKYFIVVDVKNAKPITQEILPLKQLEFGGRVYSLYDTASYLETLK